MEYERKVTLFEYLFMILAFLSNSVQASHSLVPKAIRQLAINVAFRTLDQAATLLSFANYK